MKLNLLLLSAVVAKTETGFTKPKRKEKGKENEVRSNPETCEATFLKGNANHGSVLDIGNSGTSGFIDMHDYPSHANCFIEVVADSNCLEITTQVIHAGIEDTMDDDCEDYSYEDYDACCPYDKFWFNDEKHGSCGCKGDNLEFGDGCNDHLFTYPKNHPYYAPDIFNDMKDYGERSFDDRIFNSNSFKFNFASDSSVAKGNVLIKWTCTKMASPSAPSDPIDRLEQIAQFSLEVLNKFFADHKRKNNWKKKFTKNADRMRKSYQRCGEDPVVDAVEEWASFNDSDGAKAISDVTSGFTKWAETYLSSCGGHKREKHHVKRMKKWNLKFQNL